jgi:hypothetical protein
MSTFGLAGKLRLPYQIRQKTSGTTPDEAWDNPEFTSKLLKSATFYAVDGIPRDIGPMGRLHVEGISLNLHRIGSPTFSAWG